MATTETTQRLAFTVKEASGLLGIGVRTIWKEIAAKHLRAVQLGGPKNTRIAAADLAEYLEKQRAKAGAA